MNEITKYMQNDMVKARFAELMGESNASAYVASVILAVANSPALQECEPKSVYSSALRAASLRLSVDPATKQAYLVPYGKRATLIVGWKGLYDMAIRTGRYRYINTRAVYEGEEVTEQFPSGFHAINGFRKTGGALIGWLGAFEMVNGYAKTVYMTVEEITQHRDKYSPGHTRKDSAWVTNPEAMQKKTVLRRLLMQWGYLDPSDAAQLAEIESEGEVIDAAPHFDDEPPADAQPATEQDILKSLKG
jgi:recombination protein RecT